MKVFMSLGRCLFACTLMLSGAAPSRGSDLNGPDAPSSSLRAELAEQASEGREWIARFGSANGYVRASTFDPATGMLYVGGSFTEIDGISANGVARWDGRRWSALGDARGDGTRGTVTALAMYQGELHAAGVFFRAGDQTGNGDAILRWDGESWIADPQPPIPPGIASIRTMVVWRGELHIGGAFGGWMNPSSYVALLRWDGTRWSELDNAGGLSGRVNALAVMDDELYVAGIINALRAGGAQTTSNRIARWDGAAWHPLASATGEGVNQEVYSLLVFGSDLYVGGRFTEANVGNPIPAPQLARWDGLDWHAVGSGQPEMLDIRTMVQLDDAIYVGAARPIAVPRGNFPILAKWDGTTWSTDGLVVSGGVVSTIVAYPPVDGLMIGGVISEVYGQIDTNIALYGIDDGTFGDGFESPN